MFYNPQASGQLSLSATTVEPMLTAQEPQLLSPKSATNEALALQSPCSTTREVSTPQLESIPSSAQLEESLFSGKDPAQPKINKAFLKGLLNLCDKMNLISNIIFCRILFLFVYKKETSGNQTINNCYLKQVYTPGQIRF